MQEKMIFDSCKHVTVSFDATKLYPNVTRVLSFILKLLYKNQENSFPKEYDSEGNPLPTPKRDKFLKLLNDTLTKFLIL
jgi:hypothetical protein